MRFSRKHMFDKYSLDKNFGKNPNTDSEPVEDKTVGMSDEELFSFVELDEKKSEIMRLNALRIQMQES